MVLRNNIKTVVNTLLVLLNKTQAHSSSTTQALNNEHRETKLVEHSYPQPLAALKGGSILLPAAATVRTNGPLQFYKTLLNNGPVNKQTV